MKVLVITRNPWDDSNSIGNTMSNFFGDVKDCEFANIYFRPAKPDNKICDRYFCVTEKDLLKNFLSPKKIGRSFTYTPGQKKSVNSASGDKRLVSFLHRHKLNIVYSFSDFLWYREKWINKKLDNFISDFAPDIVFTFVKSNPQYYLTVRHLKRNFGSRIILWIADDEYTGFKKENTGKARKCIKNLEYILGSADKVYGCSEEICDYYNGIFNCNATPLYKHCYFKNPVRDCYNTPLKIVYAGNMLFGRVETLKKLVSAVNNSPELKGKCIIDIYSNTSVSDEDARELNIDGVSVLHPPLSYDEICDILSSSDFVLHIESFDPNEIIKTRFSFSTKIIDCLQSGSTLMAIGPGEAASIRYIKNIPGALVSEDIERIEFVLKEAVLNPESIPQRAMRIRDFAVNNHGVDNKWIESK